MQGHFPTSSYRPSPAPATSLSATASAVDDSMELYLPADDFGGQAAEPMDVDVELSDANDIPEDIRHGLLQAPRPRSTPLPFSEDNDFWYSFSTGIIDVSKRDAKTHEHVERSRSTKTPEPEPEKPQFLFELLHRSLEEVHASAWLRPGLGP